MGGLLGIRDRAKTRRVGGNDGKNQKIYCSGAGGGLEFGGDGGLFEEDTASEYGAGGRNCDEHEFNAISDDRASAGACDRAGDACGASPWGEGRDAQRAISSDADGGSAPTSIVRRIVADGKKRNGGVRR